MPVPAPDAIADWVSYLSVQHDAERSELEAYDRYYEGSQPLTYMHPEILREVSDRITPVIVFWPQLVVDSVEERLDVEGFRLPRAESGDDDMWRVWQYNNLDEESQKAHIDALVMRRSYVSVGTNEGDELTPLVVSESPLEMYADIDPRTRKVRAALKRVSETDGAGTTTPYTTLYLPDVTIWFEDGKEVDRDEHKLGEVPIVPILNRPRLQATARLRTNVVGRDGNTTSIAYRMATRYGRSELDAVIPLSDAACKLASDMMVASEFIGLPLRGIFGIGPGDLEDASGNRMTAIQAIMGRLFTIDNSNAKAFEFAAARLDGFATALEQMAQMVASVAGLPPHYLGISTQNPASADAIRSAESRLVKRAERKQRAFGGSWEQVMRLVRRFQRGKWDQGLVRLETVWRNAATPTIAQKADATVKLHSEGIITTRQARLDLEYTDAQIRGMEKDEAAAGDRLLGIKPAAVPDMPPTEPTPTEPTSPEPAVPAAS
jgi:hypothetical protein